MYRNIVEGESNLINTTQASRTHGVLHAHVIWFEFFKKKKIIHTKIKTKKSYWLGHILNQLGTILTQSGPFLNILSTTNFNFDSS